MYIYIYIYNRHFIDNNVYSIDEVWYKRAVEYNMINNESYVYSVPFENGKLILNNQISFLGQAFNRLYIFKINYIIFIYILT